MPFYVASISILVAARFRWRCSRSEAVIKKGYKDSQRTLIEGGIESTAVLSSAWFGNGAVYAALSIEIL